MLPVNSPTTSGSAVGIYDGSPARPAPSPFGGLGDSIARASYLRKWLLLGAAIGVIAGLGAVAFYELLKVSTWLFLHLLVGYDAPAARGEASIRPSSWFGRPWAIPFDCGLGRPALGSAGLPLCTRGRGARD